MVAVRVAKMLGVVAPVPVAPVPVSPVPVSHPPVSYLPVPVFPMAVQVWFMLGAVAPASTITLIPALAG